MTRNEINDLWNRTAKAGPKEEGRVAARAWLDELERIYKMIPDEIIVQSRKRVIRGRRVIRDFWPDLSDVVPQEEHPEE